MPVSSRLARKMPSIRPTVGKFCTPEKPSALRSVEEAVEQAERVGAVDAGQHRRALHHRQHLAGHLHDDLVGVAVGQQAGERAAAGHAVAAGVVDDDEVDAAGLLALGREAGAGAAADDRLAPRRIMSWKRSRRSGLVEAGHDQASAIRAREFARRARRRRPGSLMCVRQADQPAARSRGVERRARAPRTAPRRPPGRGTAGPARRAAETPPSGIRKRTGPSQRLSRSAIQRPCGRSPPAWCASASPAGCAGRSGGRHSAPAPSRARRN